jgi:hypothetical protein
MANPTIVLDLYGIWGNRSVAITQIPFVARLTFEFEGKPRALQIVRPSSCAELTKFLDGECCHIAVFDRNAEEANFLEFGRFRVELGDEDGPIGKLEADEVRLEEDT